jgi:hypothetical protein
MSIRWPMRWSSGSIAYAGRRSEGKIYWPIWDAGDGIGTSLQTIVAQNALRDRQREK